MVRRLTHGCGPCGPCRGLSFSPLLRLAGKYWGRGGVIIGVQNSRFVKVIGDSWGQITWFGEGWLPILPGSYDRLGKGCSYRKFCPWLRQIVDFTQVTDTVCETT